MFSYMCCAVWVFFVVFSVVGFFFFFQVKAPTYPSSSLISLIRPSDLYERLPSQATVLSNALNKNIILNF